MTEQESSPRTLVDPAPVSEFTQLAQLAFASRHVSAQHSAAARNLVYLSPDALDMDLSDPMQRDFGDYELLEKVGQGGMGVVYRAHQRSLDREVALKLLIAGPWAPARFIERFQLEAQSAARLEHPNIVTVYEGGSQQDLHYFSMRLVRGEALSALLRRGGRLPPREAARILRIVADAVDYAHRLGVLHLDLKPGNVLIDASGEPLVADFGLARRLDQALADPDGDASGTPSYMAPEQADAKTQRIGRATDIYGLGCILYEMLCGQPPFSAATPEATLERVLRDDVTSPRVHGAAIPRDLEAICLKCLTKDPAQRYPSAAALAEDLRSYLDDRPVSVRRPPPLERMQRWIRREPRFAAAVAGVAVALVVGLAATAQQWQRAEGNALAARQLIWEGRREAARALEQDGRGLEAWERLLTNLEEQEAAGALEQAELERLRIGVMRAQGARLIDTTLVPDASPMATGLSADGSLLALAFNDLTVRWYGTDDLAERGRVALGPALMANGAQAPWRTSDGEVHMPQLLRFIGNDRLLVTLVWIANRVSPTNADTWLVDLNGRTLVEPPDGFTVAAYSADGSKALLDDGRGGIELWQTEPWTAESKLAVDGGRALGWLLRDDGRWAFSLGNAMRGLRRHDLLGGTPPEPITVGSDAGISAWALSSDGRHLALGDFDGEVFVLDVASLALRRLPTQRGREITWLAFSEDDAWLAVAENDGIVQVVDVAAGSLLVGVGMRADFALRRVGISRRARLVVAVGEGQTALWRVPLPDIRVRPADRIGTVPAEHELTGRYPIGWSLEQGLLASAGIDGQIRLWRLPPPPTIPAQPARQLADAYHVDEQRLIDIAVNELRLVSPQGRALTRWLTLEQTPGFAQLLDRGRILLVTVGAELHTYDTDSLSLRYPPVELPATPQRMLASADGRFVLLSFGAHGDDGHEDRLRSIDAVTGRWLPGEIALEGPVQQLALSPDRRRIVALGQPAKVTTVLERRGLTRVVDYPHDPFEPVVSLAFDDHDVLLLTRPSDPRYGRARILRWNLESDDIVADRELGVGTPRLVLPTDDGYVILGDEYDSLVRNDTETLRIPRLVTEPIETMPIAALSPDGRILARAFRNEVQLHEAATGELIGLPLVADIRTIGLLTQVAFTSDGRHLRSESIHGSQVSWATVPETDSITAQRSELARLLPDNGGDAAVFAPTVAERRRLRSADPGPWLSPDPRPPIQMARNSKPGVSVPARSTATSPLLLDLSSAYNRSPWQTQNTFFHSLASMRRYPIGVLHLDGYDFDVRGFAQLGLVDASRDDAPQRVDCLAAPATPTAAYRLLVHNGLETPVPTGQTLARLSVHYRDGTVAELPLRAGVELMGYNLDDGRVPTIFAPDHALTIGGGPFVELSAPRLANPHPERMPRCLDLEWSWRSGTLELFAITAEPLAESGAVIAADGSGSIRVEND